MFNNDWIGVPSAAWLMIPLTALGIYLTLLVLTRLAGLRSFSKMSSFDFAVTVATGSVVAATLLSKQPGLLAGAWALAWLFGMQALVSWGRRHGSWVSCLVDNRPLLLMAGPHVIAAHLDQARITEADLYAKLRMAGITHREQLFAVVLETTGDVSVLKRRESVELELLEGVRGLEHLPDRQHQNSGVVGHSR